MTCVPATRDPLDPFGAFFASYLKKLLQRIRNVLQVTYRRCYNVAGTSWKLLDENVTTYQEHLASYWTKMLQRTRNVLKVTWRCYNVSGTSCKLLTEDVTTQQEIVIDNADHRTLLHPPTPPPQKKCAKVTTVPPLDGRRCQKHVYLLGGAITILKNMSSSMGRMTSHILWNIKIIWNHQPGIYIYVYIMKYPPVIKCGNGNPPVYRWFDDYRRVKPPWGLVSTTFSPLPKVGEGLLFSMNNHPDVSQYTLWLFNSLPWCRWPIEIDGSSMANC